MKERIKNFFKLTSSPAAKYGLLFYLLVTLILSTIEVFLKFRYYGVLSMAVALVIYYLGCALVAGVFAFIYHWLRKIKWQSCWMIVFGFLICIVTVYLLPYIMMVCLSGMLFVYLLFQMIWKKYTSLNGMKKALRYFFLVLSGTFFLFMIVYVILPGQSMTGLPAQAQLSMPNAKTTDSSLEDPSAEGDYEYKAYYYAAADQKIDPYPGQETLESKSVNASLMLSGWTGLRTQLTGIKPETLPLNARVWMPQGEGPFPIVLIVHGNHDAGDRSDGGYGYLGEMLASQGYIALSVDENFLNSSAVYDYLMLFSLNNENGARAYLMLEHLRMLFNWNQTDGNLFYEKIDFDRVALIGHSRGGEAVALAAAFDEMEVYPDNGRVSLKYPFRINTVIALSPVFRQFDPAEKELTLKDTNYLVLHGAQDMDVTHFMGADTWHQVDVTRSDKGKSFAKAKVHLQNANHGQFNSDWGRVDFGQLTHLVFQRNRYMEMEDQQQAAKVFVGAFLRAAMLEETEYFTLFSDFSGGAQWLPATTYTADFMDSETVLLSSFDEDILLNTSRFEGITYSAAGFREWTEKAMPGPDENSNRVLSLMWENKEEENPATFTIEFDSAEHQITTGSELHLSLSAESEQMEITGILRAYDQNGKEQMLSLEDFGGVPKPIAANIYKQPLSAMMDSEEPVLQRMVIPFAAFDELDGEIKRLDWELSSDDGQEGCLLLDDIRLK